MRYVDKLKVRQIESELGLSTLPINWPIGSGEEFRGVIDRFSREVI